MTELNNQEKLAGLIKEQVEAQNTDIKASLEVVKEENAKLAEENKEWREALDKLQGQKFVDGKDNVYQFKGYNTDFNKNFKATLTHDECEKVAKVYYDMAHHKAIDFASEMPQGYGTSVLGLAELNSSALSTMNVVQIDRPVFVAPVKATRETSDAQASATANTATSITASNITWTIDKRIGSYAEVRVDQLEDALFDIVNGWVIPLQAEGIGQYIDGEVFNGTNSEFTSSIVDVTSGVTASGAAGIAAAITYANLNTLFYTPAWERGLGEGKWYGGRTQLKDIMALTDDNSFPIMRTVPVNGRPVHTVFGAEYVITPVIANTPAAAAMRLCFGDPSHYTIMIRGGLTNLVNPYILMKEDVVQFIAKLRADGNVDDNATAASSGAFATLRRVDS